MNFAWWIYLFCCVASAINGSGISVTRIASARTIIADRRRYYMSKRQYHQNHHQNTRAAPLLFRSHCFQNEAPYWSQSYINILDFRLLTNLLTSSCCVIPYHSHHILIIRWYTYWKTEYYSESEVFTAMNADIVVSWAMTQCSLGGCYHFREIFFLHLKGKNRRQYIFWNVRTYQKKKYALK
jgi:hypothetical protein